MVFAYAAKINMSSAIIECMVSGISRNITYHYVTLPGWKQSFQRTLEERADQMNFPIPGPDQIQTLPHDKAGRLLLAMVANGKHVVVDGRLFELVEEEVIDCCSAEMEARLYDVPV